MFHRVAYAIRKACSMRCLANAFELCRKNVGNIIHGGRRERGSMPDMRHTDIRDMVHRYMRDMVHRDMCLDMLHRTKPTSET